MRLEDFYKVHESYVSQVVGEVVKLDRVKQEETLVNFLCYVQVKIGLAHIGHTWLQNYMIFQLDYWRTKTVKFGSSFDFNKVFAKNSLDRFIGRSEDFNWYNASKNLGLKYIVEPQIKEGERVKRRQVLAWCLEFSGLYNGSFECLTCKSKEICKKIKHD